MSTAVESMIEQSANSNPFSAKSRYHQTAIATFVDSSGREIRYARRRFVPAPNSGHHGPFHVMTSGERIDHLAHEYLGDAELAWRIWDQNLTRRPWELTRTAGIAVRLPGDANVASSGGFFPI